MRKKRKSFKKRIIPIEDLECTKKVSKKSVIDELKKTTRNLKSLIEEKEYEEAEQICLEHLDNKYIRTQYLSMLIKKRELEKAKEICEKYSDEEDVIPYYITISSFLNEDENIDEIGKTYPYNRSISRSYALALMRSGRYQEAMDVCKIHLYDEMFADVYSIIAVEQAKNAEKEKNQSNDNERVIKLVP